MKLILVESPTKARTLSRFLGKGYRIEATFGHIRDLSKSELSVDVDHGFTPKYVIPRDKSKRVKELKSLVKKGDRVILATDPDREGEAIAYHMAVILSANGGRISKETYDESRFDRITFHEITQEAIKEALTHPGKINIPLVNAQQARRVLDRLVGYTLSPLIQKKLARGWLSAGRVQSVAVRLIVEREREIQKFAQAEYWKITGTFSGGSGILTAELTHKGTDKYESSQTLTLFDGTYTFTKTSISSRSQADTIIADLSAPFTVTAVEKKEVKRSPPPPYTTSAMQIDAGRKLGFTAKRTMQTAQKLYEEGLITYHRTDSVNLSTKFLAAAAEYIKATYGEAYSHYRTYATKSKLAQEAHEAIRPTDVTIKPPAIYEKNGSLQTDHERLYDLIWKRALASQTKEAIFDATTIKITSTNSYVFTTQGSVIIFDGYLKITGYETEAQILPPVKVGDVVQLTATNPQQKFTAPPPRYSEASLIKALEEAGIGRPSTYAPTLSTIQDRQYVEKETKDGRRGRNFIPTELGLLVNDFLVKYFPKIVDLPFTATMEEGFDEIAQGVREWVPVISEFYGPFKEQLQQVETTVEKLVPPQEKTGEMCPECKQGELIIKEGRFGKFVACTRFPDCKYTKNLVEKIGMMCPTCKVGEVVVKKTKTGKTFYGCSRYPECTFAAWNKPVVPAPNQ